MLNMATLNLLSLNVGTSSSLAGVSALVNLQNIDIVLLQEVRISSLAIENLLRGFRALSNIDDEDPSKPGTAMQAWK